MTWAELAREVETAAVEDLQNPLGYNYTLPELEDCKAMIVYALRFADSYKITWPPSEVVVRRMRDAEWR